MKNYDSLVIALNIPIERIRMCHNKKDLENLAKELAPYLLKELNKYKYEQLKEAFEFEVE